MRIARIALTAFAAALVLPVIAARAESPQTAPATRPAAPAEVVIAVLQPASGSGVSGWVKFAVAGGRMEITAEVTGLTPGKHGFHIHELGDCTAPDATSAGAHFNPSADPHAAHGAAKRHAGDLGNLEADASGTAKLKVGDDVLSFDGDAGILGRAVIVHADPDDFTTQPTGNAGKRVACGVIRIGK